MLPREHPKRYRTLGDATTHRLADVSQKQKQLVQQGMTALAWDPASRSPSSNTRHSDAIVLCVLLRFVPDLLSYTNMHASPPNYCPILVIPRRHDGEVWVHRRHPNHHMEGIELRDVSEEAPVYIFARGDGRGNRAQTRLRLGLDPAAIYTATNIWEAITRLDVDNNISTPVLSSVLLVPSRSMAGRRPR